MKNIAKIIGLIFPRYKFREKLFYLVVTGQQLFLLSKLGYAEMFPDKYDQRLSSQVSHPQTVFIVKPFFWCAEKTRVILILTPVHS